MFKKLNALFSKRDKHIIYLLLIASVAISLLETIGVSIIMPFIAVASDFSTIQNNAYYKSLYDYFRFTNEIDFVAVFGGILILFYFFRSFLNGIYFYALARFSRGKYHHFSYRLFENYMGRSYRNFTSLNSSQLTKTVASEAQNLTLLLQQLLLIASEAFVIIFIYSILLYINYKITFLLTLILLINGLFLTLTVSKTMKKQGQRREEAQKYFFDIISTTFGNFKMIKLKSKDSLILDKFNQSSFLFAKSNIIHETLSHIPRLFLEAIGFSIIAFIVVYLVLKNQTNISNQLPLISIFILGLYRLMPSVNRILNGYNQILFYRNSLDIVHNDLIYEIEDLGEKEIIFKEQIILKEVSFGYEKDKLVLENINLSIFKGDKIAFIGDSGSGKSTFVDLIIGLYRPKKGTIYIDDQLLSDDNIKSWRKKIGYIPQNIYLFDGTVADNVAFSEAINIEKVRVALKKAEILDFLETHHMGINTQVGEGGIMLSGGQKQRIAIARALYSNPDILVLDEATSALDSQTESRIMSEIYEICKEKTLIIIAHRLSTIEKCDKIYKIVNRKVSNAIKEKV